MMFSFVYVYVPGIYEFLGTNPFSNFLKPSSYRGLLEQLMEIVTQ